MKKKRQRFFDIFSSIQRIYHFFNPFLVPSYRQDKPAREGAKMVSHTFSRFHSFFVASCSQEEIGHQADSYRISLAAILWRYIGEGLSQSNFPPERNITQNFPATPTHIETACMFSHESRVFSRESRENLRELKGASVLRIKISIYIKYGSEPLLLIIYASYCALSVNAPC